MKKMDVKKYTKLTLALISAGVVSAGLSYWASSVKIENANRVEAYKSVYMGKFLTEKIGKDILLLGNDYLGQENLNEANFNKMMESKTEFDVWLKSLEYEREFSSEVAVVKESWKDLSDQMDFLKSYYNSSIKNLSNKTEAMMVTRKNRAYMITQSSDNLPNDVPFGAENTINNQKIEFNSSLKQTLRNQVEKTVSSYLTNGDAINKALNQIVEKSNSEQAALKAEAMRSYFYIAVSGTALIALMLLVFGGGGKKDDAADHQLALILNNVKDGFFVMTPNWEIVGSISGALGDLLNKELSVGDNFHTYLQSVMDAKSAGLAKNYLKLLIEKNLTEKLVANVNPLKLLNVGSPSDPHMISIALNPIKGEGAVTKVLVTVHDASEQKRLEDTVKMEKTKSSNQFDFLLKMMQSQEQTLYIQFFRKLQEMICDQNEKLKEAQSNEQSLRDLLVEMQREIHTVKGQAGILDLGLYQQMLHEFEDTILDVKKIIPLRAEDMHKISFFHKDFLEKTGDLISALEVAMQNQSKGQSTESAALNASASLVSPLPAPLEMPSSDEIPFHQGVGELNTGGLSLLDTSMTSELGLAGVNPLDAFNSTQIKHVDTLLSDLLVVTRNASEKMNKNVNLSLNLSTYDLLSEERRNSIRSILMHLVNNSIAHGIELPADREKKNKYPVGMIQIFDEVVMDNFQEVVTIHVVDDGAGLNIEKIKAKAIDLGLDIGDGTPSKLIPLIFQEDFSTSDSADLLSGRGIGLNYVKAEIEKLGGSINMKMRPGNYIEFSFKFNLSEF